MTESYNPLVLKSGDLVLDCDVQRTGTPCTMGILNVTPDSFSDGGAYMEPEIARVRAEQMIAEGAQIIDVGGASSRPRGLMYGEGASVVSAEEEISRVVPVIQLLAAQFPGVWISIDTFSSVVAKAALGAGARMINDITGLRADPELADVAAAADVPIILMHSIGEPGDMPQVADYDNVVDEVKSSLSRSILFAEKRGAHQIVVDPGFGFGKTVGDNLKLINGIEVFKELGKPVMVGLSRKSTIGSVLGSVEDPAPIDERMYGTLGSTAVAVIRGASIVRTHDVKPTVELLRLLCATLRA